MGRSGKKEKAKARREARNQHKVKQQVETKGYAKTTAHQDHEKKRAKLMKQKQAVTKRFENFKQGNAYQLSLDGSCYEGYGSRGLNQQYRSFQQELKRIDTALRDLDPEAKLRHAQEKRFGKEMNLLKASPNTRAIPTEALFHRMPDDITYLIRRSLGEGKFVSGTLTCSHFKRIRPANSRAHCREGRGYGDNEEEEEEWEADPCTCNGKYLNARLWNQFVKRRLFMDFSLQALQEKDLDNCSPEGQERVVLNVHHYGFAGVLARDTQSYTGGSLYLF